MGMCRVAAQRRGSPAASYELYGKQRLDAKPLQIPSSRRIAAVARRVHVVPTPMLTGLVSLAVSLPPARSRTILSSVCWTTPLSSFVKLRLPSTLSTIGLLHTNHSHRSFPVLCSVVSVRVDGGEVRRLP